eukprot:252084_1
MKTVAFIFGLLTILSIIPASYGSSDDSSDSDDSLDSELLDEVKELASLINVAGSLRMLIMRTVLTESIEKEDMKEAAINKFKENLKRVHGSFINNANTDSMIKVIETDFTTFVSNLGSSTTIESMAEGDAIIAKINSLIGMYEKYKPTGDISYAEFMGEEEDYLENESTDIDYTIKVSADTFTHLFIMFLITILSVCICAIFWFRKKKKKNKKHF